MSEEIRSQRSVRSTADARSPRRITVFDTTLRDGEQAAGVCFSARDKTEIAARLEALGVDVIEAGFPVNSPEEAAAVAAVALEVRDARVCALARAVRCVLRVLPAADAERERCAGRLRPVPRELDEARTQCNDASPARADTHGRYAHEHTQTWPETTGRALHDSQRRSRLAR